MTIKDLDKLHIATIDLHFKEEDKEDTQAFFCGTAHILLKYTEEGGNGWKPHQIEICLNDDDDYDATLVYQTNSFKDYQIVVSAILNWMQETEKREVSFSDLFPFSYFVPFRKKLKW